jgi:hypothetical protein
MWSKEFKFRNGDEVIEKITGFRGVITGTCFYLTGCNQYLLTAKSQDGKEPVALWYDEGSLDFVSTYISENEVRGVDNGCDIVPSMGQRGA